MSAAIEPAGLRRRTVDLLVAQLLRNLAPILLLLMLARLTDQETVGRFSLTLAIATPIFVLAQLGLRTVSLTLVPDAGLTEYTKVQLVAVGLAFVAVVVIGLIAAPSLLVALVLVSLLKTADAFTDFLSGPLQRRHRSRTILVASVVAALVVSTTAATVLLTTGGLEPTILAVALVSIVVAYVCLYLPARRASAAEPPPRDPSAATLSVLKAGLPLGLTTAVLALVSTFPQYVVTATEGAAETARFAVLLYVYALADLVTAALAQAWVPTAQQQLLEGEGVKSLTLALRSAARWTVVYVPVVIIGLLLTAQLFPAIFGPGYTLSLGEAIPLGLAILTLPVAHFTAIAVAIENYYTHSLLLAAASAVVAMVACVVLIPVLGLAGGFVGLFASVLVRAGVATAILLWFFRVPKKGVAS